MNSRFQGRYIRALVGSSFVVMLCYGIIFYRHVRENYDTLVKLSPVPDEVKSELYQELNNIVVYLSGYSLLFLVSVAVIGLVYSHRVAGPLFKIKNVCKDICEGNTSARITLRPNDDFRDVAEQLNQLIDVLQKKSA
ncbi:MAG: HAMP domain-containing protein [Silvanigrellaceae bacterium]